MSKHNYTQYSDKKTRGNKPAEVKMVIGPHETAPVGRVSPEPVVLTGPVITEPVVETVKTVALPKTVEGVVANCAKLNVREEPNTESEIVCVLDVTSEIEIDVEKSTNSWFKICTATGVEGYCMRKYVDAHL